MNKNEFLKELKDSICMLEDNEQADIVSEYSQHIDMKVKEGMSEADAIADFGPFDQLIEEILGAYHVKAPEKNSASDAQNLINGGKQVATAAVDVTKKGYSKLKNVAVSAIEKSKETAAHAGNRHREGAHEYQDHSASECQVGSEGRQYEAPKRKSLGLFSRLAGGFSSLWNAFVRFAKTAIRWCWNFCVACFVLFLIGCAMFSIFAFGFCIVLMLQGYPLIGVTLALLGGTAALASFALLALRLLWLRRHPSNLDWYQPIERPKQTPLTTGAMPQGGSSTERATSPIGQDLTVPPNECHQTENEVM